MLAQEVVERAYREAAIKGINSPPITPAELDEGLSRLNGFLASLFGAEIGEKLREWQFPSVLRTAPEAVNPMSLPFPANLSDRQQPLSMGSITQNSYYVATPPPNVRVLYRGDLASQIYFPSNPSDGARMAVVDVGSSGALTLNGNGRLIDGATTITLDPGFSPFSWFYRSDLATWILLAPLTLTDQTPLPADFDDLLITGTAIRLTGLDEIDATAGTMFIFKRLLALCKQRYNQTVNVAYGAADLVPSNPGYSSSYSLW